MRKSADNLPNEINIIWCVEDIKNIDDTLTQNQCREILDMLKRTHDASIGINWEVIESAIDFYKKNEGYEND